MVEGSKFLKNLHSAGIIVFIAQRMGLVVKIIHDLIGALVPVVVVVFGTLAGEIVFVDIGKAYAGGKVSLLAKFDEDLFSLLVLAFFEIAERLIKRTFGICESEERKNGKKGEHEAKHFFHLNDLLSIKSFVYRCIIIPEGTEF